MKLIVKNQMEIGEHFKLENIFIGTIKVDFDMTINTIKGRVTEVSEEQIESLVKSNIITSEEVDVIYKTEEGYVRFVDDNEKMQSVLLKDEQLSNIVPITDYYIEEQLVELEVDNIWVIGVMDDAPLRKYNQDYNK